MEHDFPLNVTINIADLPEKFRDKILHLLAAPRCATCKHFEYIPGIGSPSAYQCASVHVIGSLSSKAPEGFYPDETFGCVHHEEKA